MFGDVRVALRGSSNRKLFRCSSTPLEQYYREAADNANTRNIPLYEGPYDVDDDEYDVDDLHAFGELVSVIFRNSGLYSHSLDDRSLTFCLSSSE